MCEMCDAAPSPNVRTLLDAVRHGRGYYTVSVTGERQWTHTVGLLESYDHPELIVARCKSDIAVAVLSDLGEQIEKGASFFPCNPPAMAAGLAVTFGPVHAEQWNGRTFAIWHDHYRHAGGADPEPDAVQVFLPPDVFCPCHRHRQPVLANALTDIARVPNRTERRSKTKSRRRRRR